jgi:hypothetical protein
MDIKVKVSDFSPLPSFDRSYLVSLSETDVDSYQVTFGELYDHINGIDRQGIKAADMMYQFAVESVLNSIDFRKTAGTPAVKIGTTLGGDELMFSTVITGDSINGFNLPFDALSIIYIGISGGSVDVNIRTLSNYFL